MRKKLLLFIAISICLTSFSQTSDTAFNRRYNEYVHLNLDLKFDHIMDYTHPVLFTISTRESMVEFFKASFDNEHMKILLDSIVSTGFGPDFTLKQTIYRKINYRMKMRILIKDSTQTSNDEFIEILNKSFENGFPGGQVYFNKATRFFEISFPTIMFGVKDNANSPWMFLGYQKNEALLKAIYPEEVIQYYKLLEK